MEAYVEVPRVFSHLSWHLWLSHVTLNLTSGHTRAADPTSNAFTRTALACQHGDGLYSHLRRLLSADLLGNVLQ